MDARKALAALKSRLVDDWKHLHRFYSVRAAAIGMVLMYAWPKIPDDIKAAFPTWFTQAVGYLILLGVIAGAATAQNFGGKPPANGGQ